MKYSFSLALCLTLALSACKSPIVLFGDKADKSNSAPVPVASQAADPNKTQIEKVPFRLGSSSFTVEKLARQNQCESQAGAGLLARNGSTEVYRVECKDGKVYMARCEMRQCSTMPPASSSQP